MTLYPSDRKIVSDKTIMDLFDWAYSSFSSNVERGIAAEFIVKELLEIDSKQKRKEWNPYDLKQNGYRIEVKFTSKIQGWKETGNGSLGNIETRTNSFTIKQRDNSDVYIFCVHNESVLQNFDLFDLKKWNFYVVATKTLDRLFPKQKTISLSVVEQKFAVSHSQKLKEDFLRACLSITVNQ